MEIIKKKPTKYVLEFGMTAEELMQLFGVTRATLSAWANDPRKKEWMKKEIEEWQEKMAEQK